MYQLRNLINRRDVVTDPKKDMNSCEDFFELVTNAHVLTKYFQLTENYLKKNAQQYLIQLFEQSSQNLLTLVSQKSIKRFQKVKIVFLSMLKKH